MVQHVESAYTGRSMRGYYILVCLFVLSVLFGSHVSNMTVNSQGGVDGASFQTWRGNFGHTAVDDNPHSGDCRACHDVHGGMGRGLLVADNSTELCGMCHNRHYESYMDSTHYLTGVLCTDCHGYDVNPRGDYRVNHSFAVDEPLACGQSVSCHEEVLDWALGQLDLISETFHALSEDLNTEIVRLEALLEDYRNDPDADTSLVDEVENVINDALEVSQDFGGSDAIHDWSEIWTELTKTIRGLIAARAAIYEERSGFGEIPQDPVTNPTEYVTVTVIMEVPGGEQLLLAAAGSISLVVSLCVGVIIGRRFYR